MAQFINWDHWIAGKQTPYDPIGPVAYAESLPFVLDYDGRVVRLRRTGAENVAVDAEAARRAELLDRRIQVHEREDRATLVRLRKRVIRPTR